MFQKNHSSKMSVCIQVLLVATIMAVSGVDGQSSEDDTASYVSAKMDPTADPCEDFYQYSCGGWLKKSVIPEDRSIISTFTLIWNKVEAAVKGLLEQESANNEKDFVKKAKKFYKSCMDLETINVKGANPLFRLIQTIFQGWPMTNQNWDGCQLHFQDAIKEILQLNINVFFKVDVVTSDKDSTKRVIHIYLRRKGVGVVHPVDYRLFFFKLPQIDEPGFPSVQRMQFLGPRNSTLLKAYEDRIVASARAMVGHSVFVDRDQAREIVDFEIELAKISRSQSDSDVEYKLTDLRHLQKDHGQVIDWVSLITDLFGMDGVKDKIAENEVIINFTPTFLRKLTNLLIMTRYRVKVNYMVWQVVIWMSNYLSEDFMDIKQVFMKELFGNQKPRTRFSKCIGFIKKYVGLAIGRLYIEDHFHPESKEEINDMIDNLQDAFDEIVDEVEWMDDITKEAAKEKNWRMHRAVGYPDIVTNDQAMSKLYENHTYHVDEFFSNMEGARQEAYKKTLRSLRLPVETKKWSENPTDTNAYYSPLKNQIMFPAGFLQPSIFSLKYPRSLNYGGIGVFIGHEITHGFDGQGSYYDKNGNAADWWSESSATGFATRTQCLVDQYGRFFDKESNMTVNGAVTLDENIADNGGLKESFKAYRGWVASRGREEEQMPGLDLTSNQLFFLGFAQLWCAKTRKQFAESVILESYHAPNRFRVIGTLQNSQEFANAFQCNPGSYMNPTNKCSVW